MFSLSWLSFCFVISAAYAGNLISVMAYPGVERPINNAKDVLDSGYAVDIYDYGGVAHVTFEATQNKSHQLIWKKKSHVTTVGPSMEKVILGETIFIDFMSALRPIS